MADEKLRIIVFGAHPDDAEFKAGGVAAMWAARGHHVKFVSATNGDLGHYELAADPWRGGEKPRLNRRQGSWVSHTEVWDIHDGELMPTLENRKRWSIRSATGRPTS